MKSSLKITFGIIVLNGEPFTRYNLRALYPFAHQIIVVEGACRKADGISTPSGHSNDGTLETLYSFKSEEDPEDKVNIITKEGFWSEKDEMSQAYAEIATGDYLWQVDIDEFYQPEDMRSIIELLSHDDEITAVSFQQIAFWGGFDWITDGWYLRRGAEIFHRVFKWESGHQYVTHRPPTVHDQEGRDLRKIKWIDGYTLGRQGIFLYHYALVFPKQVLDKCDYYSKAEWATHARSAQRWAHRNYLHLKEPFRVHNVYGYPSWIEQFRGKHPPVIQQLIADIKGERIKVGLRQTDDLERLLSSWWYRLGRLGLKAAVPFDRWRNRTALLPRRLIRRELNLKR